VLLIVVDCVISAILAVVLNLNSVTGIIAILGVVTFTLMISLVIKSYYPKQLIYFSFNMIIAPLVFYMVICLWLRYTIGLKIEVKSFSAGSITYELDINKQHKTFAIYEVKDKDFNHLQGISGGEAFTENDTTYLQDIKNYLPGDKNDLNIYI
jgi:hypothetical protein